MWVHLYFFFVWVFFFSFSGGGRFEGEGIFGGGLAFCLSGVIYVQAQVQFPSMSIGCSPNLTFSIIYLDMPKALIDT